MSKDNTSFSESMKELNSLAEWFQQDDFDLEEGLTKLRRGKDLIVECQKRLNDVENEFLEIKEDMEAAVTDSSSTE